MIEPRPLTATLLCCAVFSVHAGASDTVLTQIMQGLAAQPSRQAHFSMQKHLSSLAAPVLSQGTLSYRRPDRLEQDTTAPQPERLLIEGGTVSITSPGPPGRPLPIAASPALPRAISPTCQPRRANSRAVQRPIPDEPPVMTTTRGTGSPSWSGATGRPVRITAMALKAHGRHRL